MPPPINPKVLKAVNAMCRGVGIDRAIQSNGLKYCEYLRRNLRRHMQKRQAPAAQRWISRPTQRFCVTLRQRPRQPLATDPMAAELERVMRGHAEAVEECAVLGLNVAVFEPVAQQQKKKKTKAKPTEQAVTTFTVPESNFDRDIRRIIETTR